MCGSMSTSSRVTHSWPGYDWKEEPAASLSLDSPRVRVRSSLKIAIWGQLMLVGSANLCLLLQLLLLLTKGGRREASAAAAADHSTEANTRQSPPHPWATVLRHVGLEIETGT